MSNPKTTIAGYASVACILAYVGYGFYIGQPLDIERVLALLAGIGLSLAAISAKDGGH